MQIQERIPTAAWPILAGILQGAYSGGLWILIRTDNGLKGKTNLLAWR